MNRDTTPPKQTLEEIFEDIMCIGVARTWKDERVPERLLKCRAAIQALIEQAKPQKRPVVIQGIVEGMGFDPYMEVSENTARSNAAWNAAIDQYDANLRQWGLVG